MDSFEESDHDHGEDTPLDQDEDDSSPYSIFQSTFYFPEPQNPTKILALTNFWERFLRLQRSLSLSITRRLKLLTPNHLVATQNQNLLWANPIQSPSKVHFHENDHPPENLPSEDSTQVMVHECLTNNGTHPSDIDTVMSGFKNKSGESSQDSSRKIKFHQRYVFARAINPPITWLIGEPTEA